ncbi:hypothetical protein SAMN05216529_13110 [Faecalicatena contorta]|uniref:Uncharacterized protein n=1 Tax=Faecalicatena contorta TaxID=39482 RepID=A0A315ZLQ4_9FIRM|nr:hypothetical protein A8805_13110 [Faecalicatena contorta]SUQ16424.1 hypothetical protein SAMN05216529_13110 [Faecalicatena contorta]
MINHGKELFSAIVPTEQKGLKRKIYVITKAFIKL